MMNEWINKRMDGWIDRNYPRHDGYSKMHQVQYSCPIKQIQDGMSCLTQVHCHMTYQNQQCMLLSLQLQQR